MGLCQGAVSEISHRQVDLQGVWLPYGNCATLLLPGEIAGGVLMIPEVRSGVKENLSENFRASLGPSSTAIDYWRCGPAGPAIMAPPAAATNSHLTK